MQLPPLDPATGADLTCPGARWLLPSSVTPPLPAPTRRFLRTRAGAQVRDTVLALHRMLIFWRIHLAQLTRYRVARFLERPGRETHTPAELQRYATELDVYLEWLERQRLLQVGQARRRSRPPRPPLPAPAADFLAALAPTLRPSTCAGYDHTLRHFHAWLTRARLGLRELTRPRLAAWQQDLHARGLHPSTRVHQLLQVRAYLRWVAERRIVRADPDDLIRRGDFPKLPLYLPRPLLPHHDRTLQRRLRASAAVFDTALLLMRRTGVRSGELLNLEYACLRGDPQRHRYLKVPLGKMYNERLVPLDPETVALVQWLQRHGTRARPRLLPVNATRTGAYRRLCQALRAVTRDFDDPLPINTHRLRHTYATELLNAGMSLPGVMRLLGHRDYRMTLRYAAVTDETLGKEYHQALQVLTQKYTPPTSPSADLPDYPKMLDQLARSVRSQLHAGRPLRPLLRRIERLRRDLAPVLPRPST